MYRPGMQPDQAPRFLPDATWLADVFQTRRQFLNRVGLGLGALGLATLLGEETLEAAAAGGADPLLPKTPPLPAQAKHVVHIFAQGAPSQMDTWDPKPTLARFDGKPIPNANGVAYASPFKFQKMGQAG